jgi:hypothetical protein
VVLSQPDSFQLQARDTTSYLRFKVESLIIPAGLITYGAIGIKNDPIRKWDRDLRNDLGPDGIKTQIDDYMPVVSLATVYGLNLAGIKGKHRFWDRTTILGTAFLTMYGTVRIIKNNTSVRRPSGRSVSSFPSGHTALAFMSAEFLHQEYKHQSVWYSIAGYSLATATGFLRIYNDKHWLTDVAAGAGIGILSTKFAYWFHPIIKNLIFKGNNIESKNISNIIVAPMYNGNEIVLTGAMTF